MKHNTISDEWRTGMTAAEKKLKLGPHGICEILERRMRKRVLTKIFPPARKVKNMIKKKQDLFQCPKYAAGDCDTTDCSHRNPHKSRNSNHVYPCTASFGCPACALVKAPAPDHDLVSHAEGRKQGLGSDYSAPRVGWSEEDLDKFLDGKNLATDALPNKQRDKFFSSLAVRWACSNIRYDMLKLELQSMFPKLFKDKG